MIKRLTPILQLVRAPATPTAASNILMGYLVSHGSWSPLGPLLGLLLASIAIYSSGMILNDVADIEEDRQLRPQRPLPSGRVAVSVAQRWGWALLLAGVTIAILVGWLAGRATENAWSWKPGVVAAILASTVVAYDLGLKRTIVGPLAMGACRGLNVLLGMSTAVSDVGHTIFGFTVFQWSIAGAIAVFVCGISFLALREADRPVRGYIALAAGVMLAGILWLVTTLVTMGETSLSKAAGTQGLRRAWWLLLFLIPTAMRLYAALRAATPAKVQVAVATSLFSLTLIDAILCYVASGGRIGYALAVASLAVLSALLSRWLYTT